MAARQPPVLGHNLYQYVKFSHTNLATNTILKEKERHVAHVPTQQTHTLQVGVASPATVRGRKQSWSPLDPLIEETQIDKKTMNPNPLEWVNEMASDPYYLLHFLTFFSYFIVRTSATSLLSPNLTHRLLYREIQAVLAFALLAAYKIVRDETWEAFIPDMLFFAKA
ncbi:unnamed protein product [Dovyalis caffra]|uniref:Uncharacterized protein n=1 Tax=Dovyalis caffra TaxID=77055 RepID=A0AAV1SN56_9ROSI|nr:unnamed protein product [Dovyalis caffra]